MIKEFLKAFFFFILEKFLNFVCLKLYEPWFKDFMVKVTLFSIKVDFFFPQRGVFILLNSNEITKTTRDYLKKSPFLKANLISLIASYFKRHSQYTMYS